MKKGIIIWVCFEAIIISGLCYLYVGGGKNYVNKNIPSNYKYTQQSEVIPSEFAVPRIKKQTGNSMEYVSGEEYDNQYFYQKEGKIYCKNNNTQPETITYYSQRPAGYWFFSKTGGYSSRVAFTCESVYFVNDFDSARGGAIYGPFNLK
jgi:hypothetical protein